ncbi:Uncharacterised protein [uncultured archaeon]|nr:Uncharacterised protein [uncultured archaeon]
MNPPQAILDAINDLLIYRQLNNKRGVELYQKFKDKNYFQGSGNDCWLHDDIKELIERAQGTPWEWLIKAINLYQNYTTKIDFLITDLQEFSEEDRNKFLAIVMNSTKSYATLKQWLTPILNDRVLQAVYDCAKVSIGTDRCQFQVLKIADLKIAPTESEDLILFDDLLEIEDPEDLIWYFENKFFEKTQQQKGNYLIMTFMRHKIYYYKPNVYFFIIWKQTLYVVENSERRLDINNPSGDRKPDDYLERRFGNMWLPYDQLLTEAKPSTCTAITIKKRKVLIRGSLKAMFEKEPENGAWLSLFVFRVLHYINCQENKIEQGITPNEALKMLEDKTGKIDFTRPKSESHADASSYLVNKYASKITSITPIDRNCLLGVIGTKEYVTAVIEYQKREKVAIEVKKQLHIDYKASAEQAFKWFETFIKSHDVVEVVKKALGNRLYPFMGYPAFTERYTEFGTQDVKEPTLIQVPILKLYTDIRPLERDREGRMRRGVSPASYYRWGHDTIPTMTDAKYGLKNTTSVIWNELGKYHLSRYAEDRYKTPCPCCKKYRWHVIVELKFQDYRQICAFFGVKPEELQRDIVEHLHQQNDAYIGNSRLQDVDPMDKIRDPFFRRHSMHTNYNFDEKKEEAYEYWDDDTPELSVAIPICNRCLKKLTPPDAETHKPNTYVTTIHWGHTGIMLSDDQLKLPDKTEK